MSLVGDEDVALARKLLDDIAERARDANSTGLLEEAIQTLALTLEELEVRVEEANEQAAALEQSRLDVLQRAQRYEAMFNQSPEAHLVTDDQGIIQAANWQAELLLHRSAEQLRMLPLPGLLPPADRSRFRLQVQQVAQGRDLHDHGLVLLVAGVPRAIRASAQASLLEDELQIHWVLVDGSARELAQRQLGEDLEESHRDVEQLTEAIRWQSTLIGAVSHDLSQPLTVVATTLETLKVHRTRMSEKMAEELLERACRNAERLQRTMGGLLSLSKLQIAGLSDDPEDTDLQALLDRVVEGLEWAHPRIRRDLGPQRACVRAFLVERVLENLLRNAIMHGGQDGTIEVIARRDGSSLELRVDDDGPGVPEHLRGDIFRPFVQADREGDGNGLGLAIVKVCVEMQGGAVSIDTSASGGASFRVRIPGAFPTDD